jgi:hypothetical protein
MEIYLIGIVVSLLIMSTDFFVNAKIYNKFFKEEKNPELFIQFITIINFLSWIGAIFSLVSLIYGINEKFKN